MTCINLKERFGDVYKIQYEESYHADRGENARTVDPWYMQIPCQHGHICPWGGGILVACTDRRGSVAKRLAKLPCAEMWQDGDDGINVKFHVDDFESIAAIMKPKRRRRLSPEHRQAAIERLKSHQFTARQDDSDERRRAQRVSRDTLDVPTS